MIAAARWFSGAACLILLVSTATAAGKQPAVHAGPGEPDWVDLLRGQWGLDMQRDLRNPLTEGVAPAALFQRVDKSKPVVFKPLIALGMETTTRGGWYPAGPGAGDLPDREARPRELWSYAWKQPKSEQDAGRYTPPPVATGSTAFDPGESSFGLWVCNDNFKDAGVATQPGWVARHNERLRAQPYKAMIYPNFDAEKSRFVPDSYIVGWEYSTNDDFQDAVTQIDNVRLLPADPDLKGILAPDAKMKKLAGDFKFVEGPAWDFKRNALYFSDIPPSHIIRYAEGAATVASAESGKSNGLMFDKDGMLIACEGADKGGGRRISRAVPGKPGETVADGYEGKKLNSPNDLWIDASGGIYFTDPRYGSRDDMELKVEGVYYVAENGKVTCVVDDLVRPNGIALSPDGKNLYVVDNGADTLWRYPVNAPGRLGKGERLSRIEHPDGMAVDARGRLYITCRGGVWVLDGDGRWIGMIETPEWPANCTFGGDGCHMLFITARTSLYAVKTQTRGWHVHLDGPPQADRP